MRKFTAFLVLITLPLLAFSQAGQSYKVAGVGFYNLENLFDLKDDEGVRDTEFTPEGKNNWTADKYAEKMSHLDDVISEIGTDVTPDGLAILGVAEVENRSVLEDLIKQPKIKERNYQIIHFDSPDKRGIDVGLLYQPKYFKPMMSKVIPFDLIKPNGDTVFTRDILMVEGQFDGELVTVLVNHWPSRSGGEARSRYLRNHSATHCKAVIDSLETTRPGAKVIVMGDLNDDPVSPSVKKILRATGKVNKVKKGLTFNPTYSFFKKGIGTTAYQDAWSLSDFV